MKRSILNATVCLMNPDKKITKVAKHLLEHGNITSWEAIQLYRATRLSAIIYNLKRTYGWDIATSMETSEDGTRYGLYFLVNVEEDM